MAAATAIPTSTAAEQARALRDVAARIERGEELPPVLAELAAKAAMGGDAIVLE